MWLTDGRVREMEAAPTFEFFKDVPKDENLSEEVMAYHQDFNDCKGLLPEAAMHHMLGVSKQRWHQLKTEYNFKTYKHFGKNFLSYPVAMEFCKLRRPNQGPASPAKAIKAMMADLAHD